MTDNPTIQTFHFPSAGILREPDSRLNPAKWTHERLVKSIISFEEKLDAEHEVGLRLVSFGSEIIHLDDVGYWGPDLVIFYGVNVDQQSVELIQHVSQTSVLLVAVKKEKEKARRIGFKWKDLCSADEED
jgi:hypothetical protein